MKAINRVIQYIDSKGINNSSFEKKCGLSNGYLGTQLRRNADLGEGVLNKVLDNCLDISPEWLLTGKGKMLKEEVKEADQQDPPAANNDKYITLLEAQVKDKEAIIKEKEEKEAMYKEKIMALENELQEYKNLKKGYQQEEEEEDETIEILPMAAEPASIPAELLKAKQGEYRRI